MTLIFSGRPSVSLLRLRPLKLSEVTEMGRLGQIVVLSTL